MADNIAIPQSTPLFTKHDDVVYLVIGWRTPYGPSSGLIAQAVPLHTETAPVAVSLPNSVKFTTDYGQAAAS